MSLSYGGERETVSASPPLAGPEWPISVKELGMLFATERDHVYDRAGGVCPWHTQRRGGE
jgi:hypothetical protein